LRLARLSEGIKHARLEPGSADLSRLERVQVLNYRINSVIISLFLSPRRGGLKNPATALQHTQQYMDNYIQGLQPESAASAPKKNELLKGIDLLEALAYELARC